jgi:hypothetical protein
MLYVVQIVYIVLLKLLGWQQEIGQAFRFGFILFADRIAELPHSF